MKQIAKRFEELKKFKKEIALFSAFWSFSEMTLGSLLHSFRFQFKGALLSALAVLILSISGSFIRTKGAFILMGLIVITIKSMFYPFIAINPMLAILIEALLAELFFNYFNFNKLSSLLFGAVALLYTFMHSIISLGLYFGFDIYKIYYKLIDSFKDWIGLSNIEAYWLIILVAILHIVLGIIMGQLGNIIAKRSQKMINIINE